MEDEDKLANEPPACFRWEPHAAVGIPGYLVMESRLNAWNYSNRCGS